MSRHVTLVHASRLALPPFQSLAGEILPDVAIDHVVDGGLVRRVLRAGQMEKTAIRRQVDRVVAAVEGGAEAVLVTSPLLAQVADLAAPLVDVPVLRADLPLADEAVRLGRRVALVATLRAALGPMVALLGARAAAAGKEPPEVATFLCERAFAAAGAGDAGAHDKLVAEQLAGLPAGFDVVVLAQASMAAAVERVMPSRQPAPVLSCPRPALTWMKQVLATLGSGDTFIGAPEAAPGIQGAC